MTVLAEGSQARTIRDAKDLSGGHPWPKGTLFEVEDFVSAEEAEDGIAFYYGSAEGGFNNVVVAAADVEQSMSVQQYANRALPTTEDIQQLLGSHLLASADGFEIDETEIGGEGKDTVVLYGTTSEGLRFGVSVLVENIHKVDF